jgi:hypothetical protein
LVGGHAADPLGAAERRAALDVGQPGGRAYAGLLDRSSDVVALWFIEEEFRERAGVEVEAQRRSSLM